MKKWIVILITLIGSIPAHADRREETPIFPKEFVASVESLEVQPVGLSVVQDHQGHRIPVSRMSAIDIAKTFSWIQQSNLPFVFPKDCCDSRAHLISSWLDERNIITAKIFVTGKLLYNSPYYGATPWNFHVAPAFLNEDNQWIILDPSIHKTAVPLETWLGSFTQGEGTYKVFVTSRFVYSENSIQFNPNEFWDPQHLNISQGELIGCRQALQNGIRQGRLKSYP